MVAWCALYWMVSSGLLYHLDVVFVEFERYSVIIIIIIIINEDY